MSYLSLLWRLLPKALGCQACLSKERRQAFGSRFLSHAMAAEKKPLLMPQSLTEAYSRFSLFRSFDKADFSESKLSQPHFKQVLQPNFVTFQLKNH
ncbi:hypothetical protein G3567_12175 [Psychroflexus sp. YR1-1]|uniref:Uncharacterized protein n=1 Tax=Psychroflexus aurantiacus TaxID=2709310 RepID=A0A6B3R5Q2_9FLAO|nr:hypothetical protein [Psychroflexus aurantiacus]NEV94900.1 hypothetical protein [Psychroflexus aurantiacus]